jgi:hypothetical protein
LIDVDDAPRESLRSTLYYDLALTWSNKLMSIHEESTDAWIAPDSKDRDVVCVSVDV